MSLILDADRRYSEICWLEAHNAFASSAYRWLYNQQYMSFDEMYEHGVRCFSIDIHWHRYGSACTTDEREIAMMHGSSGVLNTVVQRQGPPERFGTFVSKLAEWLNDPDKSRDIITVTLESYIGDKDSLDELWDRYELKDKMYIHPSQNSGSRWNDRARWPTLGELREAGTRLVVFSNKRSDCGNGVNYARSLITSNHWNYGENPDGDVLLYTKGALVKFNHIQPNSVNIGSRYKKFNSYEHLIARSAAYMLSLEDSGRPLVDSIPNFVYIDHVGIGSAKNLVDKFNRDHVLGWSSD